MGGCRPLCTLLVAVASDVCDARPVSPYPGTRTLVLLLLPEGEQVPDTATLLPAAGKLPPGAIFAQVNVHQEMLEEDAAGAFEAFARPLGRRLAREYSRARISKAVEENDAERP